ncbi:ComEC/Rec2 family competence protein [Saccharopolyspora cebuensis]|uniref:ComEC/Rec2 family competence protein n=1 Tax=Saccharopolyspora cebuensis TaxID=418759 RepID=A0ABV4CGP7_9PSEU
MSALRPQPLDLRLAPAALAVWAVTLAGLLLGWVVAAVVAVLALVSVPVLWAVAGTRRWGRSLLVVLVLAGIAAAGTAQRGRAAEDHPLRGLAERGGRAVVGVELTDAPVPLRGASYGARRAQDRSLVRAELRSLGPAGRRAPSHGAVVLLVPSASWRDLIAGQRVLVEGRIVPPRSGELTIAAVQVRGPPIGVTAPPGWQRTAEELREGLRVAAAAVLGPAAAGLLPGLVVGDTGRLPAEVEADFRTAGLAHLTAVSGANLAIVCGAALLLLRLVGAGPVVSALAAGAALAGFVVLAGPEPSVLRAAVMGAITLLALVLGRERSALPALSASVVGLVLVVPELATSLGFALSVAATAGLVVLAPAWAAALHRRGVPPGPAEVLVVPLAAQVVTAPLIAAFSGEISLVSVVANLLAGPVVAPATVLGVLATVLHPVAGWLGEFCVLLAAPELAWVLAVAEHAAAVPGAVLDWPSGLSGGLLLAGLTVALLVALRFRRVRGLLVVGVLGAWIVLVPVRGAVAPWPPAGWAVVACDVGQGDGLVLATGRPAEAVVVDTGPDPALMGECLRRLGVRRVPLVVLTHLHADHVSGLAGVVREHPVGAIGIGPLREPAWAMREIAALARGHRVPVLELVAGQRTRWPHLVLDVLGPRGELALAGSAEAANDASVVLMATTRAGRVLLTGDVELPGQSGLLASGADLRADVLKVPHHGSRYTAPRFLRAVGARVALVSVGDDNGYGHPSPLILGELRRAATAVRRTDLEGAIAVLPGPRTVSRGDPLRADDR